jgi:N-acetylglucosamine-6-sulfatase
MRTVEPPMSPGPDKMLKTILAALTTALLTTAAVAQQPNIIVIMVDDVPDNLAALPRSTSLLPLATRYTNSFVNFPLCGPSRATFLTGQEAQTHGVRKNPGFLPDRTGLITHALKTMGYATALFGKTPNGFKNSPNLLGFDYWATIADLSEDRYFDPPMNVSGVVESTTGYTTDIIFDHAKRWIDSTQGQPYFAWIASIGGHAPNDPAPRYVGACATVPFTPGPAFNEADVSDKPSFIKVLPILTSREQRAREKKFRDQCDTVQADDEWIERLVLSYANENTCVFFTSDNGFLLGQHRETGKILLYEESIRVPLIWWGCGAEPGKSDARLVSNADLPATILQVTGATPLRALDGKSLFGEPRQFLLVEGVWDKKGAAGVSLGVRDAASAYFEHSNGEREFYDMAADPYQLTSIPRQ